MIGETLGSYRVTARIGEGGMGVVYLAEHPLIGRKAAVKLLLPEFSQKQEIVNRFFNEARATTMIKHPGLVDIFDFGYHASGCAYIVMEFLEGESLAGRLRRERVLHPAMTVAISRQLASALGAAHEKGIVHRDLKPDNIYLVPDRDSPGGVRVKVLDFGIAKLATEGASGMAKTRTGSVMGTPLYMSPEQCRGAGTVDHRADIYSLGCILFEMTTGRPPFQGEGSGDLIVQHLREAPPLPSQIEPTIPADLETVVLRLIAKNPNDRPQSMEELARALDTLGNPQPSGRSRSGAGLVHPGAPTIQTGPGSYPGSVRGSTTLGSSAGQLGTGSPALSGRKWLVPVLAVAVAGGGAGIFFATRSPKPKETTAAAAPLPAQPAAAVLPAAPARVTLSIKSDPAGAEVFNYATGVRVGKTPLDQQLLATTGEVVYLLKLDGHEDARVTLSADHDGSGSAVMIPTAPPAKPQAISKKPRDDKPATSKPGSTTTKPAASKPSVKKPIKDETVDPFGD